MNKGYVAVLDVLHCGTEVSDVFENYKDASTELVYMVDNMVDSYDWHWLGVVDDDVEESSDEYYEEVVSYLYDCGFVMTVEEIIKKGYLDEDNNK